MPRFVILEHETLPGDPRPRHWDLLLEWGPALRTWALAAPPAAGLAITADPLPDHRRLYLDFEGELSGGRGRVARWDAGEFDLQEESPSEFRLRLFGQRLQGLARLGRALGPDGHWTFTWNPSNAELER